MTKREIPSELIATICELAVRLAEVDHSGFVLFEKELSQGRVHADYPKLPGLRDQEFDLVENEAEQKILADHEPFVIEDVPRLAGSLGEVGELLTRYDIGSLCIVKVFDGDTAIGSFSFDYIGRPRPFDDLKKTQCKVFADLASMAITNRESVAGTLEQFVNFSQAYRALEEQTQLFGHLLWIWNKLESSDDLPAKLQRLAEYLVTAIKTTFCHIFVYDDARTYLDLRAAANYPRNQKSLRDSGIIGRKLRVDDWEKFGDRLRAGNPYQISNQSAAGRTILEKLSHEMGLATVGGDETNEIRRIFVVPLRFGDTPLGLLSFGEVRQADGNRGTFTEIQSTLARSVAGQLTAVLYRDQRAKGRNLDEEMREKLDLIITKMRDATSYPSFISSISDDVQYVHSAAIAGILLFDHDTGVTTFRSSDPRSFPAADEYSGTADKHANGIINDDEVIDLLRRYADTYEFKARSGRGIRFECSKNLHAVILFAMENDEVEFASIHERVLDSLAQHAAITLRKLLANEYQLKIKQATNTIAETLALGNNRALERVAQGIKDAVRCDAVTIFPLNENRKLPETPPATAGLLHRNEVVDDNPNINDSPPGRMLAEYYRRKEANEPAEKFIHVVRSPDILSDPLLKGKFIPREQIRAAVAIPILSSADRGVEEGFGSIEELTPVGVLFVNYRTEKSVSTLEIDTIKLCAHFAALAIRNNKVYLQALQDRERLGRLLKAATALGKLTDLAEISQRIAKEAFQLATNLNCEVNYISIRLADNERKFFSLEAVEPDGMRDRVTERVPAIIPDAVGAYPGVVGRAIETRQDEKVDDVSKAGTFLDVNSDTKSEIVVLIRPDDRSLDAEILGTINVESRKVNGFSLEDFESFKLLGRLSFDRLYISQQYTELAGAKKRERAMSYISLFYIRSGILMHNNAGKINRLLSKFAQYLNEGFATAIPELTRNASDASAVISNMSYVDDESSVQPAILSDSLADFKQKAAMNPSFDSIEVILVGSVPENARLVVDKFLFGEVLRILADNSLRALQSVESGYIKFSTVCNAFQCRIEVEDNGPPVPDDVWEKLFEEAVPDESRGGHGIGLLTAALVLRKFGGSLYKLQKVGKKFGLTIPFSNRD